MRDSDVDNVQELILSLCLVVENVFRNVDNLKHDSLLVIDGEFLALDLNILSFLLDLIFLALSIKVVH